MNQEESIEAMVKESPAKYLSNGGFGFLNTASVVVVCCTFFSMFFRSLDDSEISVHGSFMSSVFSSLYQLTLMEQK